MMVSRSHAYEALPLVKWCIRCLRWFEHTEFWRTRTSSDGLYYACKECMNTEKSERTYQRSLTRPGHKPWKTKKCVQCRRTLAAENFSPRPSHRSGLYNTCKPCENARQRRVRAQKKAQKTTGDI